MKVSLAFTAFTPTIIKKDLQCTMLCSARKKGKVFLFSSHFLPFVGGWINF